MFNFDATGTAYADDGANSVMMAAGITAATFLFLTAFTLQSRIDFGPLRSFLSAATVTLLLWVIIMSSINGFAASPAIQYWYALMGSLIYTLYIVYDTWSLSTRLGPDDYIEAAAQIYLDVINLFIFVLRLLALSRRD